MTQCIIYPYDATIAIVFPAGELAIDQVARKDVPAGVPYRIIDTSELPADHTFRDAWQADFSSPDGHGIGAIPWLIERKQGEIAELQSTVDQLNSDVQSLGAAEPVDEQALAATQSRLAAAGSALADAQSALVALEAQL